MVPLLRAQYELCVQNKRAYIETREQHPYVWVEMQRTIPAGYIVDAYLHPEPDWERLGVGRFEEEEYFSNDRYARIYYSASYSFSEDGQCALQTVDHEEQEIDDGVHWYTVDLKNKLPVGSIGSDTPKANLFEHKRIIRRQSPLVTLRQGNADLAQMVREHPAMARILTSLYDAGGNRTPGVRPGISARSAEIMRELFDLQVDRATANRDDSLPRLNDENFVLGHACTIISISRPMRGRVWLWQAMPHYPTELQRPIILKTEVPIAEHTATQVATRFEFRDNVPDAVFRPPPGIPIERR